MSLAPTCREDASPPTKSEDLPSHTDYIHNTIPRDYGPVNTMLKRLLYILALTSAVHAAATSTGRTDTTRVLGQVTVTSRRPELTVIPEQSISGDRLERINSRNVAEALRYFSGVQIKDYGGIGGIKTANIRSMGSHHTGVVYDGILLGNAQNGQIDLSQFSLDNIETVSVSNGQRANILQPARDLGLAGTIYMRTRAPYFDNDEKYHLRAVLRSGSFDLINAAAVFETRLSSSVDAQISAEFLNSSGKYRFRYHRIAPSGLTAYDTTATRSGGDILASRVEVNLLGRQRSGSWQAKVYNYTSKRGVPGAIVNNVWHRGERMRDNNTFIQGRHTGYFGRLTTLSNIKYASYHTRYVNRDTPLPLDNRYDQQEMYLSTANMFAISPAWHMSASYDFAWNTMTASMKDFARPTRISHYLSAATELVLSRFRLQASVAGSFINDRQHGRNDVRSRHVMSPAVFISFLPMKNFRQLSLRAFFKQSYRMPTFNDLYYTDVGNAYLDPEHVSQYNAGISFRHSSPGQILTEASIDIDGYYNYVKDKIVAYPSGQQFRWTMLNLGRVDIRGIDVSASASLSPGRDLELSARIQYTWQRAIDITDPADSYYRDQIPYTPHHSGSAVVNATWRQWGLNCSWIYSGERYSQPENIRYNHMEPWYTADLSISRDFSIRHMRFRILAEANNLLAKEYEVISNYPMPRRSYRLTLSIEL